MSHQPDEEAMIQSIFDVLGPEITSIQWADDNGTVASEIHRPVPGDA